MQSETQCLFYITRCSETWFDEVFTQKGYSLFHIARTLYQINEAYLPGHHILIFVCGKYSVIEEILIIAKN